MSESMLIIVNKKSDEYQVRFWADKQTYFEFQNKCKANDLDVKFVFDYLMRRFLNSKIVVEEIE